MSLVDDVSVSQTPIPEPATITLMMAGFAGVGGLVRLRFHKA